MLPPGVYTIPFAVRRVGAECFQPAGVYSLPRLRCRWCIARRRCLSRTSMWCRRSDTRSARLNTCCRYSLSRSLAPRNLWSFVSEYSTYVVSACSFSLSLSLSLSGTEASRHRECNGADSNGAVALSHESALLARVRISFVLTAWPTRCRLQRECYGTDVRVRVFFVRSIEGMLTTTVGLSKVGWLVGCR